LEDVVQGIEGLAAAVQRLSLARSLDEVKAVVRSAARHLTGADGATLALRDGDHVLYADEDAIAPLWKGQRYPLGECVSGWAIQHRAAVVVPDVDLDERVPRDRVRATFVRSMLVVPIRTLDPVGAIGNYWAVAHAPTSLESSLLQALADSTAVALENVRIREELEQVADRSAVVTAVNKQLEQEIEEHWKFAAEVYRQSVTDELTGLYNRRGFFKRAEQELAIARAAKKPGVCLFLDVDGLKDVNDAEGHDAGDRLLVDAADMLRTIFRDDDVLARIGGDEFAVFVPGFSDAGKVIERLRRHDDRVRLSIGACVFDPDQDQGLYELLGTADADMYDDKRARRTG
jgi:diguanylate cyclase (GGDEF)-like protein